MDTGVFEVLGPTMIGPSSSHTAGACNLGLFARKILSETPVKGTIYLHGSFQKTRHGHGTELAILGGLLGMKPEDERLKLSKQIAEEMAFHYKFVEKHIKNAHPNTCKISLLGENDGEITIAGASIGGGSIQITQIEDFEVCLSGSYHALITKHLDKPGVVYKVTEVLSEKNINIAFMQMSRVSKGAYAFLVIETDEDIPETVKEKLQKKEEISEIRVIHPL